MGDVMQRAIVYVVVPDPRTHEGRQMATLLLSETGKLLSNKSVFLLGEFVWEVNFQDAPDALALLVSAFERLSLPYGILPLDTGPQWIRRDPGPI